MTKYELYMEIEKKLKRLERKATVKIFIERILNYVRII